MCKFKKSKKGGGFFLYSPKKNKNLKKIFSEIFFPKKKLKIKKVKKGVFLKKKNLKVFFLPPWGLGPAPLSLPSSPQFFPPQFC